MEQTKMRITFLWDIFVLIFVVYLLNMICLNLLFLYKIVCKWVFVKMCHIVVHKFLETVTSHIAFMGRDEELKRWAFSLYPFHFSTVSLSLKREVITHKVTFKVIFLFCEQYIIYYLMKKIYFYIIFFLSI